MEALGLEDQELLDLLFSFSYGDKIKDLYEGRWEQHYPSQSEADRAFLFYLAFVTRDKDTIDRIFRNSGLYHDKWERVGEGWIEDVLDEQDDFYSPDPKHLKPKIESMFLSTLFSPIPYKSSQDLIVELALLSIAHANGSYTNSSNLIISTSERDLELVTSIDRKFINKSIKRLSRDKRLEILEVGKDGKSSIYSLPMDRTSMHNLYTNINTNTVLNLMALFVRFLNYSSLNPAQIKAILMIAVGDKFSVTELKSLMRHTRRLKEFRDEVIHPLRRSKLINLDKKKQRYVKIRSDWEENLEKIFDQEKKDKVFEKVRNERDEYYQCRIHDPVEEFLTKMGWTV